jgi:uncharacterized membrane protein
MGLFNEIIDKHPGKIIGILIGLAFGWFAIKYGFFKALFVAACVVAGYYIGKRLDEKVDFKSVLKKYFGENQ